MSKKWFKVDGGNKIVSLWTCEDHPNISDGDIIAGEGLEGIELNRTFSAGDSKAYGPPYVIDVSVDKKVISADGNDVSTITFTSAFDEGQDFSVPVFVDGVEYQLDFVNGVSTLEIVLDTPTSVKIALQDRDLILFPKFFFIVGE